MNRKEIPDPGQYDIIPPDMNYRYFENPGNRTPRFKDREFSLVNAWWFAECAFLAYCHPGFARMAFQLAGFDHFRFFQGKGTECMVSWNRKAVIVSFRGTELKSSSVLHEIRTDLNTLPVDFDRGGKVHKGFLKGLEEVWSGEDGLEQFLITLQSEKRKRPLWICGHSLGGALATLCFARIPHAAGLYVYGAPRVGDQDFVDLIQDRPVWRVEHGRDPVPMVPPDLPSLDFNFKDPGQLVFISRKGEVLMERPVFSLEEQKSRMLQTKEERTAREKELSELWTDLFDKNKSRKLLSRIDDHLQMSLEEWKTHLNELHEGMGLIADDHQPVFYASKLWNALADS
ncbi:MAG: lipase family protein [Spirochaetales bacterium]|nr:lipase family protein [Spirochaetales bacterium]